MKTNIDKGKFIERRRFPRLKDNLFIFYRFLASVAKDCKAITQDVSASGFCFESETRLLPFSEMEVEIYQPLTHSKEIIFSMPIIARVVWVNKIDSGQFEQGNNKYRIGVYFSRIHKIDQEKIINYVQTRRSKT
ncbi:MAG: PilZ domain-containing protein [Candidatus Omnitrophota bacterium]